MRETAVPGSAVSKATAPDDDPTMLEMPDTSFFVPLAGHGSGQSDPSVPEVVIRISEPALFAVCFCVALAALLAFLVLDRDEDENKRSK